MHFAYFRGPPIIDLSGDRIPCCSNRMPRTGRFEESSFWSESFQGSWPFFFAPCLCNHWPGLREPGLTISTKRTGLLLSLLLVGLGLLMLAVFGMRELPFIQIWVPPWDWREITYPMMLGALVLMAAGLFPRAWLHVYLRRPIELGVLLLGMSHLLSNGDLVSMAAFGLLTGTALFHLVRGFRKLQPRTGVVGWDIAAILLGSTFWVLLLTFHGHLFGVAVPMQS